MTYHPDDRNLSPADHGKIVHDDALGRIVQNGHDFDAWDWQCEYLGGFTSYDRACAALVEAGDVH